MQETALKTTLLTKIRSENLKRAVMDSKEKMDVQEVIIQHEKSGRYFEVDGVKAFARDQGEGEVVLCIHGVPTSSFLYRKVIGTLASKGFRGVCIDLPGLGLSSRPENFEYSFPSFASFIAKATKVLEIEKFHLVVHDIGGPIGFYLAAQHPEKIRSITILNTWIDVENFEKPLVMRPFEKKVIGEAELKMITHTTWPVMFSKMGVVNSDTSSNEEIKAYVDLLKREDNGKAFLKIMRNFADSKEYKNTCLKAVQQVSYPVQAIWGDKDPALNYERYGKEVKELANLKEVHRLPSRHFLQEEVWLEIAEKIEELAKSTAI